MTTACTIDREPTTQAELEDRRCLCAAQLREVVQCQHEVTCPCGHRLRLWAAYRCRQCGLYFCGPCALRHFGLSVGDGGEVLEASPVTK